MSDQPAPAPKPAPRRAEQDQATANLITATRQMIESARDDAAIAATLAGRGYDADKFSEGLALQQAAQDAFTIRQTAMAAQKQAAATLDGAEATAREMYLDFRETVRAVMTASADRTALGLTGKIPEDLQKFITTARASYTAAQSGPYAATLATYGFPAAAIAAAVAALDALSTADQAQTAAIAAAVQATANRDAAVKAVDQWSRQFKRIAAVALRAQPAQAKKLGL